MSYDFNRLYPPTSDPDAANAVHEIWITKIGNNHQVMEFASELKATDKVTYWRLRHLIEKTAKEGKIRNEEMYRHIGDGVYEFKARVFRVYSFDDGRRVILTHGDKKRSNRAAEERDKVAKIRVEYFRWRGSHQ